MKKICKLFSVFLFAFLTVIFIKSGRITSFAATSGTTGDCRWSLDGTVLTISGNGAMGNHESLPWGTSITEVIIKEGVTTISYSAFENCYSLTSIIIPNSVTTIRAHAFSSCSGLTSVTIPDSVTSIGWRAFYNTGYYSNSDNWENDVLYIGNHLIEAKETINGEYIIKSGTKTIDQYAFHNCSELISIIIPNSVTSIGMSAFSGCSSLQSITLPFVGSSRDANETADAVLGYIFDQYLSSETRKTQQYYKGSLSYTYYIPSSLKSVTITNDPTIPYGAFYNCSSLTSVIISDSIIEIGDSAFYNCDGLTSITIGSGVTTIGEDVFSSCKLLSTIEYNGTQNDWNKITIYSDISDRIKIVYLKAIGWENESGNWYYYVNGVKQTGWISDNGTWYYMNSDGVMQTGWLKSGNTWYYLKSGGAMATGWEKVNGTYYYFNGSGAMQNGWLKSGNTWYYLKDSGAMATGWANVNGTYYYFNGSGAMQTGWLKLGNTWYYLKDSGAMATGSLKIGNKWYSFNSSGAWIA